MKHIFITLIISLLPTLASAQDAEMSKLVDMVKGLRSGGSKAFEASRDQLAQDALWTPMNELRAADATVECRASDRVPGFRLNKLLAGAEQKQRFETSTGNMLNGEDERYNYSLYERAIKAGRTAKYTLKSRHGAQTFYFLPYKSGAKLSISVEADGHPFEATSYKDGSVRLSGSASGKTPVTVTIKSTDGTNQSFVLINHNTRR